MKLWSTNRIAAAHVRMDAAIACGLYLLAVLSLVLWYMTQFYPNALGLSWSLVMLAAIIFPLTFRRVAPSAVAVVVVAAFVASQFLLLMESLIVTVALFMALYSVGAWEKDRARANWVRGILVCSLSIVMVISLYSASSNPELTNEFSAETAIGWVMSPLLAYMMILALINLLYFAAAIWFGNRAWSARHDREHLLAVSKALADERLQSERQAVALERMRIARELHDAVAHHLSLMGVQAAAARLHMTNAPDVSAQALQHVEQSAGAAVSELQSIVHTLREEGIPDGEPLASLGVDGVPALVAEGEAAGLKVDFQVVGEPTYLPPLTSLNLYRIAQESLTNALRHAGAGTKVGLRLRYFQQAVEVETFNSKPARRQPRRRGSGLGLVGMRERAESAGGTFNAGRLSDGGFVVYARLPLEAEMAETPGVEAAQVAADQVADRAESVK